MRGHRCALLIWWLSGVRLHAALGASVLTNALLIGAAATALALRDRAGSRPGRLLLEALGASLAAHTAAVATALVRGAPGEPLALAEPARAVAWTGDRLLAVAGARLPIAVAHGFALLLAVRAVGRRDVGARFAAPLLIAALLFGRDGALASAVGIALGLPLLERLFVRLVRRDPD